MNSTKQYRILDGTILKTIAMISMAADHVGDLFFPGVTWLRMRCYPWPQYTHISVSTDVVNMDLAEAQEDEAGDHI